MNARAEQFSAAEAAEILLNCSTVRRRYAGEVPVARLAGGSAAAPTARDWLLNYAGDSDWSDQVDRVLAQHRAEVLAEAVEVARSKRLTSALFGSGIAYNNGITDAVAAIGTLTEAGESRD